MKLEIKQSSGVLKYLLIVVILGLSFAFYIVNGRYMNEKETSSKLAGNALALTEEIQQYKIQLNDSTRVTAAKIHQLTLQRDDYKRLYKGEAILNRKLKIRIDELQSVTTISTITRDTVQADTVYIDSNKTYRANYSSKWIDIGFIAEHNKDPAFTYAKRDSLTLLKEVEQARLFWGLIKWNKEKSATYHLVSHDEKTKIAGFVFKEIIK